MPKEIVLEAVARESMGSGPAGRLRRQGKVPAVIYGHGTAPKSIAVDARQLRAVLHTESGMNALISLKVDGDSHLALAREAQMDAVRGVIRHVDFLIVNRNEEVTAEVPLNLTGEAEGVKRGGGVMEHHLFALPVKATPDKIPTHIDADISHLNVGDSLHVRDITPPPGVVFDIDGETTIVLVDVPRAAVAAEAAAAEGEAAAAEGEAAPAESTEASS